MKGLMWIESVGKDLATFVALVTTALAGGLIVNQFQAERLPWVYHSKAERLATAVESIQTEKTASMIREGNSAALKTASRPPLAAQLDFERFAEEVERGEVLILDARPEIFHRLGHVPGAISLPRDEFETRYAALAGELEGHRERPVILYCASSSCEDADLVRTALEQVGYEKISVFVGGWAEWERNGKPVEIDQ